MTKNRIHLVYSILLSISLLVSGILLIAACVGIYRSGDRPFSPEAVAAAFSGIAVPLYLCLALIVGGFILEGFFPATQKKCPPEKQYKATLSRLWEKCPLARCPQAAQAQLAALERKRRVHKWIGLALLAAGSIVFLCYGLDSRNFHQTDITGSMTKAMYLFIPCLGIPFGYGVFSAFYSRAAMEKEIAIIKQAIADGHTADGAGASKKSRPFPAAAVRYALLGLGIAILLYGFFAGGTNDVLTKAVNICTECVGLG